MKDIWKSAEERAASIASDQPPAISSSPAGSEADQIVDFVWQASAHVSESPAIRAVREKALQSPSRQHFSTLRRFQPLALAACLLLFLATGVTFLMRSMPGQNTALALITGPGEQRSVRLSDGSEILLDSNSRFEPQSLAERRGGRLVYGRALFTVAHDARHPFIVTAQGGETTALGTRFVVDNQNVAVSVQLLEGSVEIQCISCNDGQAKLRLVPGQQAQYAEKSTVHLTGAFTDRRWISGQLSFENDSLPAVAQSLSRYTAKPIHIAPSARLERVTGVFDIKEHANFADALAVATNLRIEKSEDGTITLKK